jgi:hypothetical protein
MNNVYIPPSNLNFYNEEEWMLWLTNEYNKNSQSIGSDISIKNDIHVSKYKFTTTKIKPLSLKKTGIKHWRKLFLSVFSLKELNIWEKTIPNYDCSCIKFYQEWKQNNPPVFPLSFEWKYSLKSAVNLKLNYVDIDLITARHIWRQTSPIKRKRDVTIVSSLSPYKLPRQTQCIQSWLLSGFKVILMQTHEEILAYRHLVDGVKFVESKTERPLIREMVQYGMIVNSDCQMYGVGPESITPNNFYLRWNYEEDRPSREEEWGLDACYIDSDILPKDFNFQIGKPFWDYAVPAILQNLNIPYRINHIPWLHHLKHKLNWNQDDWHQGQQWVLNRFTGDYSSPNYRASMDPEYIYNKQLGMYIKHDNNL